jgi:hypothetical protein
MGFCRLPEPVKLSKATKAKAVKANQAGRSQMEARKRPKVLMGFLMTVTREVMKQPTPQAAPVLGAPRKADAWTMCLRILDFVKHLSADPFNGYV